MRRSGDEAAMSVVVMVTSQQPLSFSSYHYAPPPSIVVMPTAELAQRCSDIYPPSPEIFSIRSPDNYHRGHLSPGYGGVLGLALRYRVRFRVKS